MSESAFIPRAPNEDVSGWAYVTGVAPLAIRMDGFPNTLDGTPDTLVSGLIIGDKVWIQRVGRYTIIHGKAS